jgi:hypothetical protein
LIQNQDLNLIHGARRLTDTRFASSTDALVTGCATVAAIAALAYALKNCAPKSGDSPEPPKKFTSENITASFVALEHVRHACRLSVAEFVRLWLEREGQWQEGGLTAIQVRFADETNLDKDPTLKFLS